MLSVSDQITAFFRDPLGFPIEFKTWLLSYLEANPPGLPAYSIVGASYVAVGAVFDWACSNGTTAPPPGYLFCDGTQYRQADYAALYTVSSSQYNTGGETSGYFRVPDIQGRVVIGLGTHTDISTMGNNDAVTLANRRAKHRHSNSLAISGGTHSHPLGASVFADGSTNTGPDAANSSQIITTTQSSTHTHPNSEFSGIVGNSVNDALDTMPFIVLRKIIKF